MVNRMDKINYIKINTKNMLENIEYIKKNYHYSYYIMNVSNNAFNHSMYLIKYLYELVDYLYVNTFSDLQLIRKYNSDISVIYNGEITEDNVFDLIMNNATVVVYDINTLKMIHNLNIKDPLNFIFYVDPTGYYGISSKQDILDYLEWNNKYLNLVGIMANLDEKNYNDFKYIIRPIQNVQLMILNNENDKRKIQGSNAILLDSSIYGINQAKKKLFQKAEKPFKQIFTLYSKVISIKEVNHNKKIKYIAVVPFGIYHGMNEAIKYVYINDKLYPVIKILNEFIYVEVDSFIKKDMQVEITSMYNPIDTYLSSQTLNYFSMFSSNIPIVFDDYILEKASMY